MPESPGDEIIPPPQEFWDSTLYGPGNEDPTYEPGDDRATNLKKRKFDCSSSWAPLLGQPTFSVPVDDPSSSLEIPEASSSVPSCHSRIVQKTVVALCTYMHGHMDFDVPWCLPVALQLEGLMKNPESFKDYYELDEMYSKCQANGPNGKRAGVWEDFTPIKVLGPDRKVMLTLAICHDCNMAYQTGKWDSKKGSLSNNGTKTLKEHNRKCSAQHHIAGNTQGAIHQMP
ncbi:unnamed protein product [Miscanthus lutarioriparius]|uniref:Uncharacterized protein n=1 Tax=Miscanthus lutarioriparius TaxID=422564 RepID=A0A811RAT8_9POAL|nr:unnamed protein product [Miscanthus lutarioriparius]